MKFIKVSNIKINVDESVDIAFEKAIKEAGINNKDIIEQKIVKYSIDARHKDSIKKLYTIGFKIKKYNKNRKNVVVLDREPEYEFVPTGTEKLKNRPVIVGFGPAGMFCGYMLAMYGYKPIIVERGSKVDQRLKKIEEFWSTGKLDENSNVQFGEGGAGTFSDGKLNTGIKDKENRINLVLKTFVENGAKENILYDAKPHVGTDILSVVVKNMRKYIESKGGTFYFDTEMTDFTTENNVLKAVKLSNGEEIETNICVLAIGHSARDTFEMLYKRGIPMEQKPFAMGLRIEHPRTFINEAQYGYHPDYEDLLPTADYKLVHQAANGRAVYSFCMCPGGYVVNASSESGRICVNGMSYSDRKADNSNSAIVVNVTPEDYPGDHPLAGMYFQRELEEKAYQAGKGAVPVQRFGDFRMNRMSEIAGKIKPCIKGAYTFSNLNCCLPEYIRDAIIDGVLSFDRVISGFADDDAILSGVEARTSSPIKILRDADLTSAHTCIYPCGEGAGYAGGITSAAVDGIKVFEAVMSKFMIPEASTGNQRM